MVQFVNLIRHHLYGATRFDGRLFETSYDRYVAGVRRHFRNDPVDCWSWTSAAETGGMCCVHSWGSRSRTSRSLTSIGAPL